MGFVVYMLVSFIEALQWYWGYIELVTKHIGALCKVKSTGKNGNGSFI